MKGLTAAVILFFSMGVSADYLTRDNGQVIDIPDGYNAGAYHKDYNVRGMTEAGLFPGKAWIDAFLFQLSLVDFPSPEDCSGLVVGPAIPDPRCKVYED